MAEAGECRQKGLELPEEDEKLLQELLSRQDVAHSVLAALSRAQAAAAAAANASGVRTCSLHSAFVPTPLCTIITLEISMHR